MTATIPVHTTDPYAVRIGAGISAELVELIGTEVRRVAVIADARLAGRAARLAELLRPGVEVLVIEVPSGEAAKTAAVLADCWSALGRAGFTRSDVIVGFGGGATTDLAGFVAATWLRGVDFVNVPTTVLGMVDAAVGGKTGIDTAEGKNLVGAFHEPRAVLCDLEFLEDLPEAELRSGMAEVVKCGFIADPSILDDVEADPRSALDPGSALLASLIERGIGVKARTVAEDLTERTTRAGQRIGREALNYGHTLGHAIERHEAYRMRHGEAISIGMVFVAELAGLGGGIVAELVDRHRAVLRAVGLPVDYERDAWPALREAMRLDKKTRGDRLRLVVLEGLGLPAIWEGPEAALLDEAYRRVSR